MLRIFALMFSREKSSFLGIFLSSFDIRVMLASWNELQNGFFNFLEEFA